MAKGKRRGVLENVGHGSAMWAGVMENPIGKRAVWTGVVVGAGLLLVGGGVAFAATRKKGGAPAPAGPENWQGDPSDAAVNAIANSISYSNTPVRWTDGQTYGPIDKDGAKWRFIMGWQTCDVGSGPYQCKHVTVERLVPPSQ
jgi:hypothetical protein